MESFLSKTADHIIANHNNNLHKVCIVLPTRRSGVFLKKEISAKIETVSFAPDIYSISDFVEMLGDIHVVDELDLLFEFYIAYQSTCIQPDSFEDYLNWAPIMLNDFRDIDNYMVPSQDIFSYINEAYAYKVWNPEGKEPTDSQREYLRFWSEFGSKYNALKEHLLANNIAHEGLSALSAATNILNRKPKTINIIGTWDKIYFTGLNALSVSEETIVKKLIEMNVAETLWDADSYYLDDCKQEAGTFIRKYRQLFNKKFKWIVDKIDDSEKEITIIGVPGNIAQVKAAGQIIGDWVEKSELENTALVLTDESLLLPLLQSLPDTLKEFNITMGVPLSAFSLHNLFFLIFELHLNAERSATKKFYYKDILRLLDHPLMKNEKMLALGLKIKSIIRVKKLIYLTNKDIGFDNRGDDFINDLIMSLFNYCNNTAKQFLIVLKNCLELVQEMQNDSSDEELNLIQNACIQNYQQIILKLNNVIEKNPFVMNIRSLRSLFDHLGLKAVTHFNGEPLKGLQIMGMLESRALNFNKIILLSASEDHLPGSKSLNSLIPFDIRKEFGLPTQREKEAIYAYHFYHLLQGVSEAVLIYNNNTETEGLALGEPSRYITQIRHEMTKCKIVDKSMLIPVNTIPVTNYEIIKNEIIHKSIIAKLTKGISLSSLNRYINCPLDFYFRDVVGVNNDDPIQDVIESSTMGSVVHDTLYELYKPLLGKTFGFVEVESMLTQIPELLNEKYSIYYNKSDIQYGRNLLIKKVTERLLRQFLKAESEQLYQNNKIIRLDALEQYYESTLTLDGLNVKIIGKADRIDCFENNIRIIDYKTGNAKRSGISLKDIISVIKDTEYNYAFQLLCYTWLFFKNNPSFNGMVRPAIIYLKRNNNVYAHLSVEEKDIFSREDILEFEELLKELIGTMIDIENPFRHKANSKYCYFCEL